MLLLFLLNWSLIFTLNVPINGFCPDDDDLQRHRCTCNIADSFIQCSSLPEQCRTCYQYETIFFDERLQSLPSEAFRFYDFFSTNTKKSFVIQFANINMLSTNAFSKIEIDQNQTLDIKISKLSSSIIPTRLFEETTIQSSGKFDIEIYNVTSSLLTIEQYAFDGIKMSYRSRFRLAILSARDTIEFQSNSGTIFMSSFSSMDLYFSNFKRVFFEEHSFDHIIQEHSSELRLSFDHFHRAFIEHRSFVDLHQLDQSQFYLMFSNFEQFEIEKTFFDTISQLNSSTIFSVYNLTEDLCLPSQSFSQIQQDVNSTFQFQVHVGKNIYFSSNSITNITQRGQSKFSILLSETSNGLFDQYSINHFHQEDRSLLDIWVKYSRNLLFEDYSIQNVDIWRSSIMRIGFQHSSGRLQMKSNAFQRIHEGQGGDFIFQIMNSTDFDFRFNESINLKSLEIIDRSLTDEDFCRIVNIPNRIPMKLLSDQQCSCSVFFLYRQLHRELNPTSLKDLTPLCYSNLSFDQIEQEENRCRFNKRIYQCRKSSNRNEVRFPIGICHRPATKKTFHSTVSNFIFSSVFIIFLATCGIIFICSREKRRIFLLNRLRKYSFYSTRQKLPIFSGDSYQQLTQFVDANSNEEIEQKRNSPRTMKILVKYNSTTERAQPYLQQQNSDFVMTNEAKSEDQTLRLNANPLNEIEVHQ